jgi:hypothetical protein
MGWMLPRNCHGVTPLLFLSPWRASCDGAIIPGLVPPLASARITNHDHSSVGPWATTPAVGVPRLLYLSICVLIRQEERTDDCFHAAIKKARPSAS